jgi:hypothetical protein
MTGNSPGVSRDNPVAFIPRNDKNVLESEMDTESMPANLPFTSREESYSRQRGSAL